MGIVYSCNTIQKNNQKIILTNKSTINLSDKAIIIQKNSMQNTPEQKFPLVQKQNGDTIPSQLEDIDGDGNWDQLFFVVDIPANEKITLNLTWIKSQPVYTIRTNVRFGERSSKNARVMPKTKDTLYSDSLRWVTGFQPYQTDGPSWENDKIGFRHYFDGRNSNDIFGKKVSYMSPDSVGINAEGAVEDNYHVMWDWGRDILSVGSSLGIGGFGLLLNDSILRLGIRDDAIINNIEKSIFTIVKEGPVHSIMRFEYIDWHTGDRSYNAEEITSIWPGMYAYKNQVRLNGLQGDEILMVGLVNSNTDEPLTELNIDDKFTILYTHDKQTYDKVWYLGLALILPKDKYLGYDEIGDVDKEINNTFYGKLQIENDKPVSYYAVGCWEISDEQFTDSIYFENYVVELAKQLGAEVTIEINTK